MQTEFSYLEAAPGRWVWALGDGLQGGWNCVSPVRIGRAFWGDPAAGLAVGEVMPEGIFHARHFRAEAAYRREVFERLAEKVGRQGIFARAAQWPALAFAERVARHGLTWRVARSTAAALVSKTPFPIFFTTRRLPLFRDEEHRLGALTFIEELLSTSGATDVTWRRPGWGLGPEDDHGDNHYLRPFLRLMETVQGEWPSVCDQEVWQQARLFIKATHFAEQVFGATWITRVVVEAAESAEVEDDVHHHAVAH